MPLYRKRLEQPDTPAQIEVLWDDEIRGTRSIVESDETVGAIQQRLNDHPSKNLFERIKLRSGDWMLATYRGLTEKQCIEIAEGTATLVSGVLTLNNSELIEEP